MLCTTATSDCRVNRSCWHSHCNVYILNQSSQNEVFKVVVESNSSLVTLHKIIVVIIYIINGVI